MALFARKIEELTAEIRTLSGRVAELRGEEDYHRERRGYLDQLLKLKEQIEAHKITASRQREEHEKEKREVAHKVGLERARQEFDAEQAMKEIEGARRDAVLEVREANLAEERKAFEKQMDFISNRFADEVGYLKEIMVSLMDRLPEISVAMSRNGDNG